jgi:hypothetical protein
VREKLRSIGRNRTTPQNGSLAGLFDPEAGGSVGLVGCVTGFVGFLTCLTSCGFTTGWTGGGSTGVTTGGGGGVDGGAGVTTAAGAGAIAGGFGGASSL